MSIEKTRINKLQNMCTSTFTDNSRLPQFSRTTYEKLKLLLYNTCMPNTAKISSVRARARAQWRRVVVNEKSN